MCMVESIGKLAKHRSNTEGDYNVTIRHDVGTEVSRDVPAIGANLSHGNSDLVCGIVVAF